MNPLIDVANTLHVSMLTGDYMTFAPEDSVPGLINGSEGKARNQ